MVAGSHDDPDSGGLERAQDLLRDLVVALFAEAERNVPKAEHVRRKRIHREDLRDETPHGVVDVIIAAVRLELLLRPRLTDMQVADHDREVWVDPPRLFTIHPRRFRRAARKRRAHSCGGEASKKAPPREAKFLCHNFYLSTTFRPLRESFQSYAPVVSQRM